MPSTYPKSQIIGVPAFLLGLAWMSVLLRCWVKIKIVKSFTIDDWLLLFSVVLFTGSSAMMICAAGHGLGMHINEVEPTDIYITLKVCGLLSPAVSK